jgi:SAM-dependent methyltransferase
MDWSPLYGGQSTSFGGAILRDGKIFAANREHHVEARYSTAYNLGCGRKRWDGWINVDMTDEADMKSDLRHLPIETDSADAAAAIHVLEHFYEWEARGILTEWKRILRPGGKLILELPCLNKICDYIAWCRNNQMDMFDFMSMTALYGDPRHEDPAMCHKWGWFSQPLERLLKSLDFQSVQQAEPRYHFPFRDMRFECVK